MKRINTVFDLPKSEQAKIFETKPIIICSYYTVFERCAFIRTEITLDGENYDAEVSLGSVDIRNSDFEYSDTDDAYLDDENRVIDPDEYSEGFLTDLMSCVELENCPVYLTKK